jgi:hypothetical protein
MKTAVGEHHEKGSKTQDLLTCGEESNEFKGLKNAVPIRDNETRDIRSSPWEPLEPPPMKTKPP